MADTGSPREIEGELSAAGARFGIVVARFNSFITDRLLGGSLDAIRRTGGDVSKVDIARVPGSLELAVAAKVMVETGRYDAIICLGAVVRGETAHFEYVSGESARGIAEVGRASSTPVVFGVLTCDTLDQAINRAGAKGGNSGFSAAMTAIEMIGLIKRIQAPTN